MRGANSALSNQQLISRNNTNPLINNEAYDPRNPLMRDPTTLSTSDIKFPHVLEQDGDTGEQTLYQVDIVNENLLRKSQRSELASKKICLTRRWQTALVIASLLLALAGGIGK
jgi:hypothetical protein